MKKINILFIFILLGSFSLVAQNIHTKKADKQFERLQFVDAAESYSKLVDKGHGDPYVYSQLAESYYNVFNTAEAERWFAKALEKSDSPEMVYKYSQMLKANGKYEASNAQMDKFSKMRPGDHRAMAYLENPDYLPRILEQGKKFNIQNLPINSKFSDFGGTLQNGKLYITSARNSSRKTYGWNEEPFLDIYEFTVKEDGSYGEEKLLDSKINTKYHEGVVTFVPDGKTMYFSRESFFEKEFEKDSINKNRYGVLQLFKATKSGSSWSNVEGLAINSSNFSIKNPSVSADGKTLYFASDMPGGFGGFDIYKATIKSDGTVDTPMNLGSKVNTEGQEMFPSVNAQGTLYFSSNGHPGLGGLDVFFTREVDNKMTPVRNMGVPVNSAADDFAFHLDEESGEGFVSSNREGGAGSDDIYAIKRIQPICDVLIAAMVTDIKTSKAISGATVSIYDDQGNKLVSKTTNAEGKAEFMVECDKNSELEVVMDGYNSRKVKVDGSDKEEVIVPIALDPIDKLIVADKVELEPIYFDFDKSNITAQAAFELDKLVQIMNKYPEMVIKATSHTDSRGSASYNERLSDRRAKTTVAYIISKGIAKDRISGQGKGKSEPKVNCGSNCSEEDHQLNRRSEFDITSGGPKK